MVIPGWKCVTTAVLFINTCIHRYRWSLLLFIHCQPAQRVAAVGGSLSQMLHFCDISGSFLIFHHSGKRCISRTRTLCSIYTCVCLLLHDRRGKSFGFEHPWANRNLVCIQILNVCLRPLPLLMEIAHFYLIGMFALETTNVFFLCLSNLRREAGFAWLVSTPATVRKYSYSFMSTEMALEIFLFMVLMPWIACFYFCPC